MRVGVTVLVVVAMGVVLRSTMLLLLTHQRAGMFTLVVVVVGSYAFI